MDTISEERIDKRVVKHDKNRVVKKRLNFDKVPAVFHSFKQSSLIWLFQVKLESNVKPRYLVEQTCLISASSILILNDWLGLSLLEWKRRKLVFKTLSANRLHFIHSATDFSSWFRFASRWLRFLLQIKRLLSSANRWNVSKLEVLSKSFTYNKKKRGPRIHRCGTPQVTVKESELWSLKCYYDQIWEFVFDYIFRKCM